MKELKKYFSEMWKNEIKKNAEALGDFKYYLRIFQKAERKEKLTEIEKSDLSDTLQDLPFLFPFLELKVNTICNDLQRL